MNEKKDIEILIKKLSEKEREIIKILKELKKSKLKSLIIKTNQLPDKSLVNKILNWIGE